MQVTYTGKINVGGSGTGTTAYRQVKPLIEEGLLEKIYASDAIEEFKKYLIKIPSIDGEYVIQDLFFDAYCSLVMEPPEILQTWGLHCLAQLREFPDAISIVNLYSAHPIEQAKMLKDEEFQNTNPILIKKMTKELEECDYIFIPSDFIYQSLMRHNLHHKAKLIPFGVDLEKFTPRKEPREDDVFRVIYVGNAWPRKGLLYLLVAWQQLNLKNAELIVAGVKKFMDIPNVKWGWIDDLVKAYQDSDVFCLPAIEDGCPLATYEAMACGIPPIVSENTGTKQHIYNGHNGFIIPPKRPDFLAAILEELYNDRERCKNMGKTARNFIEGFPWERHEKGYVEWIKSL